jgi:hypothetical protein
LGGALGGLALGLVACRAPPAEIRTIEARILPGCALGAPATVALESLDDGPPRAGGFLEVAPEAAQELPTLPPGARLFVARANAATGEALGLGLLAVDRDRAGGAIYRVGARCGLRDPTDAAAVVPNARGAAVAADARVTVLAGGRDEEGGARSDLLLLDGVHGLVRRSGLRRRRADPAVVVLGDRALVAGGEDGTIWEDAEWITVADGVVDPIGTPLAEPRAEAAAIALPTGEALLVGGRGPQGALSTLEIVDPVTRTVRTIDLVRLARPRRAPKVALLAGGAIAVAGGRDDAGAPITEIEILGAGASDRRAIFPTDAGALLDLVALPSGVALAIVEGDAGALRPVLVREDGLEVLSSVPRSKEGGESARLVPATDGRPFLWDGALRRFDPWSGTFAPFLEIGAQPDSTPIALGSGAIGFLRPRDDDRLAIEGARYDVRNALSNDPGPLGLGSTAHLVPDRPDVTATREGLVLPAGARVAIADTTYADFSLRIGGSGRALPIVELEAGPRSVRIGDGEACAWPAGDDDAATITREGDALAVDVGGASVRCSGLGTARARVVVAAGAREARIRGLTITRR